MKKTVYHQCDKGKLIVFKLETMSILTIITEYNPAWNKLFKVTKKVIKQEKEVMIKEILSHQELNMPGLITS